MATSPTLALNQAQAEKNRLAAIQREQARQAALNKPTTSAPGNTAINTPTNLAPVNTSLQEGSTEFYQARGFDPNSAKNLADQYNIKMGNTTSWVDDKSVTSNPAFQSYAGTTIGEYEGRTGQNTGATQMYNIDNADYESAYERAMRARREKLAQDARLAETARLTAAAKEKPTINTVDTLTKVPDYVAAKAGAKGDRTTYDKSINYAGLSDEEKKKADLAFGTGLRTVTPDTTKYKGIADFMAEGKTRGEAVKLAIQARKDKVPAPVKATTTTVIEKTPETEYMDTTKTLIDTAKSNALNAQAEDISTADKNKSLANTEIDTAIKGYEDTVSRFQAEQDALLKSFEGNRLNQVQGQLRQALIARGVDINNITPEQLIALSGAVGVEAFKDISDAKERAKASIEQTRQSAMEKINTLRANKTLNETQYNTAVADINQKTQEQVNNLDLKYAELAFGIKSNVATTKKADETAAVQNILNVAQSIGLTGTQFGLIGNFIKNAKTTPEAIAKFYASLQDPNSPIYTAVKSNTDAATKAAQFAAQLKQFEAETDRLKAEAAVTSANRPRSSGGGSASTTVQMNPDA